MSNRRILLVDDDADFLHALGRRCESMGLIVEPAHNLLSATISVQKHVPDIICTDVEMPTGSGLAFCKALAADRATSRVPIIVLTGQKNRETKQACERLHTHYLEKSIDYWPKLQAVLHRLLTEDWPEAKSAEVSAFPPETLSNLVPSLPALDDVVASRASTAKQVLVADDDTDIIQLLSERCSCLGCSVIGVNNALDALNVIHQRTPDLVCLDVSMPSGNGLSVCEMMASDESLRKIPIIILTGRRDESVIRRCHDLLVYYVEKGADTWSRVEPLMRELLQLGDIDNARVKTERSTTCIP